MGIGQIAISVCNDGNVAQLDCAPTDGKGSHYRIEVYRASQPSEGFGVTICGSRVEHICGREHLSDRSNKIFRYMFALTRDDANASGTNEMPVILEGREEYNPPGTPNGSWDVRIRDLDPASDSYGSVIRAVAKPTEDAGKYDLHYDFMVMQKEINKVPVTSPLKGRIEDINKDLTDLGDLDSLPAAVDLKGDGFTDLSSSKRLKALNISVKMKRKDVDKSLAKHLNLISHSKLNKFRENLDEYEEFGDFGAKAIHPGTNLTGPNASLAAESIFVRQYRAALVLLGRLTSPEMANGADTPVSLANLRSNTRPGVYNIFIGAAINHVGIYKLGLDKVHSDYGGIPMRLAPGSRLENDADPVADAWRCNQTLGELANVYYLASPPSSF
jgi:hypothetical protein